MRIYLDNCCYNRLLDDRSNSKIYYERNSVMLILELVEKSAVSLIGSEMLVKEMIDTNNVYKRSVLQMVYGLCSEEIKVDALLTTDRKFMNNSNRIQIYTKVMDPSQWLLEVLY